MSTNELNSTGDRKLTTGDFEDRFSIDKNGRLKYNGAIVETAVGLKRRDFVLALTVAVFQGLNMLASWVNATKKPAVAAPVPVTCPAPIVTVSPPPAAASVQH